MRKNKTLPTRCHFTLADIEQMATIKSFERGEELLLIGAVQKITKNGNRFDGKVFGSREYKLFLIDDENDLQIHCNCPYSFGGICKHSVAFALKILDGEYQEIAQKVVPALSYNEFYDKYSKVDTEKKLLFLKQLLDRDRDLQQQFIAFSNDDTGKLDNIVGEKIDEVRESIHYELSNLDFNNLHCSYDDYGWGGYRESWEIEYDAAIDAIKDEFEPYIDSISTYLRKGNLLDAFRILLGLYEGAQNLPYLDSESCIFGGTYVDEVDDIVCEYFSDISSSLNNVVKSDKAVKEVISLIFSRLSNFNNQKSSENEGVFYNLKYFESILKSLIISKETARFLYEKIQENKLQSPMTAHILLNIATVSSDEKLWLDTAETYANLDDKIAKQLLKKYYENGKSKDFNRIAKMAFRKWADKFDKFLIDHLDKKQEKKLYVKALKNYVSRKQDVKYYHILRPYLSEKETIEFVDKFKNTYPLHFYVQLLETEKRYEEILNCVRKNKNDLYLDKLIKPILNVYPQECFSIIVEINNNAINNSRRNRNTYQEMVRTLKLLPEITTKKKEAEMFLKSLYNHKPNLPALKDEMRKANLIVLGI